jgi:hypothetical protein
LSASLLGREKQRVSEGRPLNSGRSRRSSTRAAPANQAARRRLDPVWSRPEAAWDLLALPAAGPPRRNVRNRNDFPAQGAGVVMTVVQGILLAVAVVTFFYLGVAMFKPEWF